MSVLTKPVSAKKTIPSRFALPVDTVPTVARFRGRNCVGVELPAARNPGPRPWWLWPHLLGLDAPLVAVTWQVWWAHAAHVALQPCHHLVLGLGVWLMYLADRLADAIRDTVGEHGTARHAFAGERRGWLLTGSALITGTLVVCAPCGLPHEHFVAGLGMLSLATAYFWRVHGRRKPCKSAWVPKEGMVGGMFALGTAFFVWWRLPWPTAASVAGVVLFGMTCFLNCALITKWERTAQDRRDPSSLLNAFPRLTEHGLGVLCWMLAAVAGAAGLWLRVAIFLPIVASAVCLVLIDLARLRLSVNAVRALADAVLLSPWIYLWIDSR